eukprot:TRINITY_DN4905_c0_g1_i1.p1 TRINITY_DN4905_c0_g1~~TRINITY_DN4905_c0_g1_i1.p1  ORF type:complete len:485 (+),score=117.61 TRINITY_DN4905_c0_g1_i1:40-1455(+)
MLRVAPAFGWGGRLVRAAHRRGLHDYKAALVAYQTQLEKSGADSSPTHLLEAVGRPSIAEIYGDLLKRQCTVRDACRASLLLSHAFDIDCAWAPHPDPFPSITQMFFDLLPNNRDEAVPLLVGQYIALAKHHGSLEGAETVFNLVLTERKGCCPVKDVLHELLDLCTSVSDEANASLPEGAKSWDCANGFLKRAQDAGCLLDYKTVGFYLKAISRSHSLDQLDDAVATLRETPLIGRMLRKSVHYYQSLLTAYSALGEREAFSLVDEVFEEMGDHSVEPTLAHYEVFLQVCIAHRARERGEEAMDRAISASHTGHDDAIRFEAACIEFHSVCGSRDEADNAIRRADVDGKLDKAVVLVEAALRHYSRDGVVTPEGHDDICSLMDRLHVSHSSLPSWPDVRPCFLETYACLGAIASFESLLDEVSFHSRLSLPPQKPRAQRFRELHTLAYIRSRSLADAWEWVPPEADIEDL